MQGHRSASVRKWAVLQRGGKHFPFVSPGEVAPKGPCAGIARGIWGLQASAPWQGACQNPAAGQGILPNRAPIGRQSGVG